MSTKQTITTSTSTKTINRYLPNYSIPPPNYYPTYPKTETYGLNLEFVKKEYERLMNLNIRSEQKKLSNKFWEKFKLTRDTGIISANDGISEIRTKIGEEKLSQLDRLEKEAMECLIYLNMKYGS